MEMNRCFSDILTCFEDVQVLAHLAKIKDIQSRRGLGFSTLAPGRRVFFVLEFSGALFLGSH